MNMLLRHIHLNDDTGIKQAGKSKVRRPFQRKVNGIGYTERIPSEQLPFGLVMREQNNVPRDFQFSASELLTTS